MEHINLMSQEQVEMEFVEDIAKINQMQQAMQQALRATCEMTMSRIRAATSAAKFPLPLRILTLAPYPPQMSISRSTLSGRGYEEDRKQCAFVRGRADMV